MAMADGPQEAPALHNPAGVAEGKEAVQGAAEAADDGAPAAAPAAETNELLWPPPLAAAAACSPAAAAAAAAGKPLPEVLRAAFDEVVMPVRVEHGQRLRQEPSGLWLPDEWLPVDSETWRMRVYGAAEHTLHTGAPEREPAHWYAKEQFAKLE